MLIPYHKTLSILNYNFRCYPEYTGSFHNINKHMFKNIFSSIDQVKLYQTVNTFQSTEIQVSKQTYSEDLLFK